MFSYYDVYDSNCLLAVPPEAEFAGALLLTRAGKWKSGKELALDFLANGEPGAVPIDESEALAIAAKLNGKWPPSLG